MWRHVTRWQFRSPCTQSIFHMIYFFLQICRFRHPLKVISSFILINQTTSKVLSSQEDIMLYKLKKKIQLGIIKPTWQYLCSIIFKIFLFYLLNFIKNCKTSESYCFVILPMSLVILIIHKTSPLPRKKNIRWSYLTMTWFESTN